jgi:hypothetical protein
MLSSMRAIRAIYDVRISKVRKALASLAKYVQHKHPLIEPSFQSACFETCRADTLVRRF